MSITPRSPDPTAREKVRTWVTSQWKLGSSRVSSQQKSTLGTFPYEATIAVAALIRLGAEPAFAAALVDYGCAVVFRLGDRFAGFPDPGCPGHWSCIDEVSTADGAQYVLMIHDYPPVEGRRLYCWALLDGEAVEISPGIYDPTEHAFTSGRPYHDLASESVFAKFARRIS